jgi:hypothetical protein
MSSDHSADETRTCPSCGRTLPLSAFYTVKAERYRGGQRVKAVCKDCDKAGATERMRASRERQPKPPPKPRGRRAATPPAGTLGGAAVAERLGISRQRVHRLAQQGKLEPVRDGKRVFYTEASVQALEREREHEQA